MTPYLQIISRLLQSFWEINESINIQSLFAPINLSETTSQSDRNFELLTPIPVNISVFSFTDTDGRPTQLELNLRKDTKELVNSRIITFFTDMIRRDEYFQTYIEPYFRQGFQRAEQPKYSELPLIEYHRGELIVGVHCNQTLHMPFISIYVTVGEFY
mgnify:CR=1 FL=1